MSEETATIANSAAAEEKPRGQRKSRVGTVISKSGEKTIVVETVVRVPHPRFKKIIKRSSKFHAHDEENQAEEGDKVRIMETKPMSKLKCWRLVEILKH